MIPPAIPRERRGATRLRALSALALVLPALACASGPWWQGMTADQIWARGTAQFEAGDAGDAAETIGRLLVDFPNFSQAAEAQFLLARAHFEDEQYISAQAEYTRFLDRYPAHPRAPAAAIGVCRSNERLSPISQRDQTFTEQAIQVCRNVANDWAGTPEADEASAVVAEMREKLARKQYENGWYYHRRSLLASALIYYEEIVDEFGDTAYAPKALAAMVDIYTRFGYDDEVEATRARLLSTYPESAEARALAGGG